MLLRLISVFISTTLTFSVQAREIFNPDDTQIDLMYRYLASDPPDFRSEAKKTYEVRRADEFNRPNVARQVENNMRRDFELMKDVDVLRIRAHGKLSEYDSDRGGFYVSALSPGTYFKYGTVQYIFENPDYFHLWKVSTGNARLVVEQLGYGRNVALDIRTRPFAVDAAQGRKIRAQVIGLDIFSAKTKKHLGTINLPEDQYREIMVAGLEPESILTPDKLNILGLSHDMTYSQVIDWAVNSGFAMFSFKDSGKASRTGADGGKILKQQFSQELPYLPDLFLSSDNQSFKLKQIKGGWDGSLEFGDGGEYSIFGSKFDCMSPKNLGVKCGFVDFVGSDATDEEKPESVKRITFAQSASGVTREQIIAKLTEKYGTPSDNKSAIIFDQYRGNMLVWGRIRQHPESDVQMYFTRETWTQNWEIEAYIIEPSEDRITVITQINVFPSDQEATISGGNGAIKF